MCLAMFSWTQLIKVKLSTNLKSSCLLISKIGVCIPGSMLESPEKLKEKITHATSRDSELYKPGMGPTQFFF